MDAFMDLMDQQEKLNQENVQMHIEQEEWEAHLNADVDNPVISAADLPTQQSMVGNQTLDEPADDGKGKQIAEEVPTEEATASITPRKRKNQKWMEKYYTADGQRIYHKNRGRSERIKNMQMSRPYNFDQFGTGSNPDNAFDVSD